MCDIEFSVGEVKSLPCQPLCCRLREGAARKHQAPSDVDSPVRDEGVFVIGGGGEDEASQRHGGEAAKASGEIPRLLGSRRYKNPISVSSTTQIPSVCA